MYLVFEDVPLAEFMYLVIEDVRLVEFMYLIFTRMQVRVTVGDSGLSCRTRVTYFAR